MVAFSIIFLLTYHPFSSTTWLGLGTEVVPIAVYNPDSAKKRAVAEKLKRQGRVKFITPTKYTEDSRTFKLVKAIIDKVKAEDDLRILASGK